jgi:hypothetical protein
MNRLDKLITFTVVAFLVTLLIIWLLMEDAWRRNE